MYVIPYRTLHKTSILAESMDPLVAAYRTYQRSRVSSCGCINTECVLEKMEHRRVERELREKIRELQLCLRLKDQKDGIDNVILVDENGKRRREIF